MRLIEGGLMPAEQPDHLHGLVDVRLLPVFCLESKARGVLSYGTLDLIGSAGWKLGVDFDGDVERCIRIACEDADDLFGNLHQTHLGGRRIDLNGAVE